MNEQALATVEEVAKYLRTTPAALYSQRFRDEAPGALGVKVGRRILFDVAELQAWFKGRTTE